MSEGKKEKINVLSLFDGMSCGQIALNKVGIKYENYFASEIDKHAIQITQKNYPDTIQLGSVTELNGNKLPKIDLLMGGSPCQDLSKAKTDGDGLNGERSGLFWEFVRLLKETNPKYFLLENVVMKKQWADIISNELGVEPIEINSNLVSAQNRRRMYWTNIPNVKQPKDKGIFIKDILLDKPFLLFKDERIEATKVATKNYIKWDISNKGYYSQQDRAYYKDGKMCCVPKSQVKSKVNVVETEAVYRRLSPIEVERLQTVPDDYTAGVSDTQRYNMLGNGWTVDVIAHIFSFLKREEIFNNFSNENVQ